MRLSKVFIKNYRNFLDEEINFDEKSLIIGANDVGKTNLLKAIRLLLDKSFSSLQLEPEESDFNIFSTEDDINIILEFSNIQELEDNYIIAKLGKYISNNTLYLAYVGYKDLSDPYKLYIGNSRNIDEMTEVSRTQYINIINCVYLDSTRELKSFLKKAKIRMINNYKQNRTDNEIEDDEVIVERINQNVGTLNCDVEQISYINKSASYLNEELSEMSTHNDKIDIKLSSYNDFDAIASNVDLVTTVEHKNIELGGDGRNNQIYISMWLKEMADSIDQNKQFIIFILEEPEAHLHLPLQAMTIRRILHNIKNQIIMSTHSPKVVLEFKPNSIIRLYFSEENKTKIANNGCSNDIVDDFMNFGYRNNLISGEMFFSDSVLLVEGPSEELLYKELSKQLNKEVERYNISVISVNGVGFMSYTKILNQLHIPFAVRTDNDIQLLNNGKYSFNGINRLIDIYNEFFTKLENEKLIKLKTKENKNLTIEEQENFNSIIGILKENLLYLANVDLENDLANSSIIDDLLTSTETTTKESFVAYMQKYKATNMFSLLQKNIDITPLKDSEIYLPLNSLLGDSDSE